MGVVDDGDGPGRDGVGEDVGPHGAKVEFVQRRHVGWLWYRLRFWGRKRRVGALHDRMTRGCEFGCVWRGRGNGCREDSTVVRGVWR
jgi:hypothetical protein